MSQSLLIRAAAAATTNGELSNGQDPALASLQPRASFATESETQASLASLNSGFSITQDKGKASAIAQAESTLEEAGWDDNSIGQVRHDLLRRSTEDINILLAGSAPRVVAALKAFSLGQSKQSDQQGHQPSIGEFIMQQPESRRSIRLSEVRSLAWAQLQHNCRLEIRVIWKMQPPHQKQADAFAWSDQLPVAEQIDACSVYLRNVVASGKNTMWVHAAQHPTLLTVDPTGTLPFSTRTTADLAICFRSTARPHAHRDRIMMLFEVTKAISTQEYYQAYAHLLLANVHAPRFRPVVVVTDLIDDWTIHWLDRRRICTFACPDRGTALAIIDCLIADPSHTDRLLAQDLPVLKRRPLELGRSGSINEDRPDEDVDGLLPPTELLVMKEHKILQELNNIPWVASLQVG